MQEFCFKRTHSLEVHLLVAYRSCVWYTHGAQVGFPCWRAGALPPSEDAQIISHPPQYIGRAVCTGVGLLVSCLVTRAHIHTPVFEAPRGFQHKSSIQLPSGCRQIYHLVLVHEFFSEGAIDQTYRRWPIGSDCARGEAQGLPEVILNARGPL